MAKKQTHHTVNADRQDPPSRHNINFEGAARGSEWPATTPQPDSGSAEPDFASYLFGDTPPPSNVNGCDWREYLKNEQSRLQARASTAMCHLPYEFLGPQDDPFPQNPEEAVHIMELMLWKTLHEPTEEGRVQSYLKAENVWFFLMMNFSMMQDPKAYARLESLVPLYDKNKREYTHDERRQRALLNIMLDDDLKARIQYCKSITNPPDYSH